ncbi:23S rRNA (adenine(2030)-N(6))-methyltransferase RlmJ [Dokdonella fugitiva]|jgi:23S rRNA (adenine2030-N6)-methyltransferase|uniref:23S rRNA (adenine(2030)-N(6))-methyltransferase RlmJ n=1 Tax=Dokdonella fugitiva TaxID=328517 RepID=UPI0015F8FA5C|nr:23S rRNA (adenine(2030)-N(6))-methyltransferase RlmJ [Dokdonella fugitiva]MBA8885415.1 23S rRNA (adenine2030-N6)-methyltransferase [Dokdonella fugitiva]
MNYRHGFHAGNFADVFKHAALVGLLDALQAKPAALCYFDTHAGRALYDMHGEQARRTQEHASGIQRLLGAGGLPAALQRYVDLVQAFQPANAASLAFYPGSPLIAQRLLRESDRAILCELHQEEAAALRDALAGDTRFAIHQRDGYAALKALLPPAQKRGLVLIDPPFEAQGAEFELVGQALANAWTRWPNATYAVWYPIKLRETIVPFHRWLREHAGRADVLVAELLLHPDNSGLRLNGCGLAIVNPPWRFDEAIAQWLPAVQELLAQSRYGSSRVEWLERG